LEDEFEREKVMMQQKNEAILINEKDKIQKEKAKNHA
jgi:hypothetical protein